MSNPKNNDAIVTVIHQRISGVEKHLKAEKAEIPVKGAVLKPASLIKLYQKSLDARAAVTAGLASYQGALKVRDEAEADRLAADESLKNWVLARFGAGSVEASEIGFAPRKVAVVSAVTRAQAVAQNKATRDARGTVGKKKKLQIKGVVPTSTAPAAPAVSPTSAPVHTLVALPALLTTSPSAATSSAPSAQVAGGSTAAPPPTVTTLAAPPALAVTPAPAVVTASVVAAPTEVVTHA